MAAMSLRTDFLERAVKDGWQILTRGLPDVFMLKLDPKTEHTTVAAVFINQNSRKLRSQQQEVIGILSRAGINAVELTTGDSIAALLKSLPSKQRFPINQNNNWGDKGGFSYGP